jgi:hypothetical protein
MKATTFEEFDQLIKDGYMCHDERLMQLYFEVKKGQHKRYKVIIFENYLNNGQTEA